MIPLRSLQFRLYPDCCRCMMLSLKQCFLELCFSETRINIELSFCGCG